MSERAPKQNAEAASLESHLSRLFGQARMAIIWERLWRKLWPCVAVVIVFLSIALLDVLPVLPFWAHGLVLVGFAFFFINQFRRVFDESYIINEAEVRHRIEADNSVAHRPLTTLDDHPVAATTDLGQGAAADHLWQVHQARAAEKIAQLTAPLPRPGLAARDTVGLRFAVVLIAIIALVSANGHMAERLGRAFVPSYALAQATSIDFDVWITPPAYTGLAPLFLKKTDIEKSEAMSVDKRLTVPVGSSVLVQISQADEQPELLIGSRVVVVRRVDVSGGSRDFRAEDKIIETDNSARQIKLVVSDQVIAEWPVNVLLDGPPEVEFTEPPKRSRRASLRLQFEARDDFSVKDVWAEISFAEDTSPPEDQKRIRFDMMARGFGTGLAKGYAERDYSAHRWAGMPVVMELFARDSAGQIGKSKPLETVLPARIFNHPVARALAEIRKNLNHPDHETIEQSLETLYDLLQKPAYFFNDTVTFLSISVARSRLYINQSEASVVSVQDLLWETALRIEDGEFSMAERDLQEIQNRLAKALHENASSEELERIMDELQDALSKYMAALAEHLERQGLTEMPMDPNARTMESMDLQNMVEQARQLAKTGAMDAAKQVLAQLNQMLEGLKNGAAMVRNNPEMARARKMMERMRGLAKRQQELMDKTFRESQKKRAGRPRQSRRGQPNQQSGQQQTAEGMARAQAELRRELGRLMLQMDEMLGAIPKGMGEADRSMKGAGQSLGEGDAEGAVPQQADALEKLRQAMDAASEQMAQQMQGRGMGIGLMPGGARGQRFGGSRDPFGRRTGDGQQGSVNDDNSIKIPSQREIYRAREIMDELHRRSEDTNRPPPELDYIDRLLRRF